ncbi:MAG: hypothetical protein M0010_16125 [Actinomycetota bacterium]|nr:hypothetical protein [Actinomycetota bacterium]
MPTVPRPRPCARDLRLSTHGWSRRPNYYAGGYYTAKAQKLIEAVETAPAKDGLEALYKDEAYLAKQLPSLWWPLQDWQIVVAKKGLSGWQHLNAYANYMPQTWYYTKAG